ncbi:DUF4145 domain-containing protein [Paenibacillus mesotrionivorans]|uniref:DUF4145 domain-containing protein n=1 Tax=Paenibacillus mesotrionivorans TaxID=3160968 RepID=A0ACC7NX73_9BACL
MLIDCPFCDVTIDAHERGTVTRQDEQIPHHTTHLLECPRCGEPIVAGQDLVHLYLDVMDWTIAKRLWPSPQKYSTTGLPNIVSTSIEEAEKCYKGKAYIACAVMCGRAIEAICKDNQTKSSNIAAGLKELLEKQIIDSKIYQWAEALRLHRNIGAHANDEVISKEDAQDLLDFTKAICDYIYLLTEKFKTFMERKQSLKDNHQL